MNRCILKFFEVISYITRRLKIIKSHLCIFQLVIIIVTDSLWELNCIVMSGYHIRLEIVLLAEGKEFFDPLCIIYAADSRTAHLESAVISLNSKIAFLKELEVLIHICLVPESRKIRLIPYFDRPFKNFFTITAAKVLKKSHNHICPHLVILWRSCITLPVEDCLSTARQLIWHKAQLQIRTYLQIYKSVEYSVKISVVILNLDLALFLILMVDSHVI